MKYVFLLLLVVTGIFAACKKTSSYNSGVLFYNATWSLPAVTAAWNGAAIVATGLAQGQSSGTADVPYIQVPAGTNLVTIKAGTAALLDKNIYAAAAASSSFIVFDSGTAVAPTVILQLTDDLTKPDTALLKYRVIDLVPDAATSIDVWLVNGTTDSIRLDTAGVFIGTAPAASTVQIFATVSYHGGNYTVKVKKTGTEQVYASVAAYPFAVQGIYTIFFSGLPAGTGGAAFKLSVLHHPSQ
jgi:hypothetical protein